MTDWNRTLQADYDLSPAVIDNNPKLEWLAAVKLAQDEDLFGSVFDVGHWTEVAGSQIYTVGPGKGNATISEAGGVLTNTDGGAALWEVGALRGVAYGDFDIVMDWSVTQSATKAYSADVRLFMRRNIQNMLLFRYVARGAIGNRQVQAFKIINDVTTLVAASAGLGVQAAIKLRIKRVAATQNFTFYYDIGAGWVTLWGAGVINDATHFNSSHQLEPVMSHVCYPTAETFTPSLTSHTQKTDDGIAAQRFWNDSPECNVINSAAGAVEYVADMGVNGRFVGSGFSCTQVEPGTSTVKFKAGYGDAADRASATFDVAWRSETELNTKVANGDFDGHRYLFLEMQFNSDGTDQPTLTDITISGTVYFIASNIFNASVFESGVFHEL